MEAESFRWTSGPWDELREPATEVRRQVFVEEMGIDENVDFDGTDEDSVHIVAFRETTPVATGRMRLSEARIGRMAVLRARRRMGIGSDLLQRLLREAVRAGLREIALHAQEHAAGFYRRHGFDDDGPRFEEAGIPHLRMWRRLEWRDVVAGLLVRDGKLLLGLRAPHLSMGGHWDLFGGKLEPGEAELGALGREMREELSLQVEPDRLLGIIIYDDCRGRGLWRCPVYRIVKWQGEVSINEEHLEARWFRPEELPRLRLAHDGIRGLAELALEADG